MQKKVTCFITMMTFLIIGVGSVVGAQKVKLTWWDPYGPPYDKMMIAMIKAVEKKHPELQVERSMVPWDGFIQKLAISVAAGNPPDVAHVWGHSWGIELGYMGLTLPLNEFIAKDPTWNPEDIYPAALESFTYKGKIWGFPSCVAVDTLMWNKKLFREVGLDPEKGPETLEDILLYSSKIYQVGPQGKIKRYGFLPHNLWGGFMAWAYHWGADFYDEKNQKVTALTPQSLKALQWWVEFYREFGGLEAASSWQKGFPGGANDPFIRGVLGMQIAHHYHYYQIHEYAPDLEYGYCEVPPGPGTSEEPKASFIGADAQVMFRGTKHPEEAYTFLKEFCFGKGLIPMMQMGDYQSGSESLNKYYHDEVGLSFLPEGLWQLEVKLLKSARSTPQMPGLAKYQDTLNAQAELAMLGKKSPEEALKYVEKHIQRELEKLLKREKFILR